MESEISLAPEILSSVEHALAEDIRTGDVTTNSIIPAQATLAGQIISKQSGIVAGLFIAQAAFQMLDKRVSLTSHVNDGERIEADRVLAEVKGTARAILSAERTALNFLGRTSGIATLTRQFVEQSFWHQRYLRFDLFFDVGLADRQWLAFGQRVVDHLVGVHEAESSLNGSVR